MSFGVFRSCFCLAFGGATGRLAWHLRHTIRATFRSFVRREAGLQQMGSVRVFQATGVHAVRVTDCCDPQEFCRQNTPRLLVKIAGDDQSQDLRYVGSRDGGFHGKWTRVARSLPATLGFNRFLHGFKSVAPGLHLRHRGEHVRSQVDGCLSGQFDHEPCSFIEQSGDALGRCGHES